MLDNLIIGDLIEGLSPKDLGITSIEETVFMTLDEARSLDLFLPRILVHVGLFKNTSEIKRIHAVRIDSKKIVCADSRNLWRTLDMPELTYFKIGHTVFWLAVGDVHKQ